MIVRVVITCEPKVDELGDDSRAAVGHHDVLRLEVVVLDLVIVQVRQGACHLLGDRAQLGVRRRVTCIRMILIPAEEVLRTAEIEC